MSFAEFEQLPNFLKKAIYEKKQIRLFRTKTTRGQIFLLRKLDRKLFWFRIYMPRGTLTMSFVWFEKLPNILKKAIYEKIKFAFFVRKQREDELFFYAS